MLPRLSLVLTLLTPTPRVSPSRPVVVPRRPAGARAARGRDRRSAHDRRYRAAARAPPRPRAPPRGARPSGGRPLLRAGGECGKARPRGGGAAMSFATKHVVAILLALNLALLIALLLHFY